MTLAMVFPGQGSQSIGMLADLAQGYPQVQATFEEASEALGYDLWELCQQGPAERLNATEQTQPAMLAAGVAAWRVWREAGGGLPEAAAGHSLGEYSALVAADSVAFRTAVRLVRSRGRFMQQAVPEGEGAIAAVLGLEDGVVVDCCDRVSAARGREIVSAVNFNAPGQVVIAGHAGAVQEVLEELRAAGARKAVPLPMSVPVHCDLMRPASDRLVEELRAAQLGAPRFRVIHNADLAPHTEASGIIEALAAQLYTPVRWTRTVEALAASGADLLVECGPGKVLTGLTRRIDRALRCVPVHDRASLEEALRAAGEQV